MSPQSMEASGRAGEGKNSGGCRRGNGYIFCFLTSTVFCAPTSSLVSTDLMPNTGYFVSKKIVFTRFLMLLCHNSSMAKERTENFQPQSDKRLSEKSREKSTWCVKQARPLLLLALRKCSNLVISNTMRNKAKSFELGHGPYSNS